MIKMLYNPYDPYGHLDYPYGVEVPVRWKNNKWSVSLFDLEQWIENQGILYIKRYRQYWFKTLEDQMTFILTWI